MIDIDLIGLLCRTDLFKAFSKEQIKAVADVVEFREYPPGRKVVRQGEPGEEFYIIAKGSAQVLVEDKALKTQQVVLTLNDGQSFGETALLADETRTASVQTLESTVCAVLSRASFGELLARVPEISISVCRYLAERLAAQCKITGVRFVGSDELVCNPRSSMLFPEQVLRRCEAIPLSITGRTVTVALTRPTDSPSLALLRKEIPGMGLEPVGCTREDYEAFLQSRQSATEASRPETYKEGTLSLCYNDGSRLCSGLRRILETLLTHGLEHASIHLCRDTCRVYNLAEGSEQPLLSIDSATEIQELENEFELHLQTESRPYAHCSVQAAANGNPLLFSLSALKKEGQARYSIRLPDRSQKIPCVDALLRDLSLSKLIKDALLQPSKVVLLEGSRESGLSTTLLSLLQHCGSAADPQSLVLLEEHPSRQLSQVTSWPLDRAAAGALAVAELQRARVVAIDPMNSQLWKELFDRRLSRTTVVATYQEGGLMQRLSAQARSHGHTGGAFQALSLVVRQTLAMRNCDQCKQPVSPSPETAECLRESGLDNQQGHYLRGAGCESCGHSGVSGRVPIFEIVRFNRELLDSLLQDDSHQQRALRQSTVCNFRDYTRALIAEGSIDPTEGLRLFPPVSAAFSFPS
jgi:cyclic nucleotide-binding protein/type II secretion system (T2SS) protein E